MATKFDARQSVLRAALGMIGSVANDSLDTIFPKVDAELAKLFEDRNILLTDGGTVTFTGTQLQFTENLNLVLNQKISGAAPQVISLGSANVNFSATNQIWYAVIDRTAGTAVSTTGATTMPAATSANQEVFLIAKRVDAGDGTQRVYFRNGSALSAGQTVRLGASGSGGSGSGTGDDLDSLVYRASFADSFTENSANANSSINATGTNAIFNAAKSMYVLSYDAAKTATAPSTTVTLSAAPAFTVAVGDIVASSGVVRKITAVASQTSYTIEAAFPTALSASACVVSQAVYTKDIYNFAVDGAALSAGFNGATFSDVLVDYKDSATSGSNIFTPNTTPVVGFVTSNDNTNFTTLGLRATNETDTAASTALLSAGTALYLRFFANQSAGSGTVNLINYKVFMQKSVVSAAGGVFAAAYAFTNSVGTPYQCSVSLVGGKTTIQTTFAMAMGVNVGSPYGSVDVLINGALIPRFINATLTPDAFYTEVSPFVIQLDRDYSAQNLSVEILQYVQIIDASTTNTSAIAAIQAAEGSAFQGFIDQSKVLTVSTVVGTPAAGTFYSTVVNRANVVDMSQDLRVRMGVERVMAQQIYQLQNEFGPNGEPVSSVLNDLFGQIRFGGSWTNTVGNPNGSGINTLILNDFVEISFFGTGANLLLVGIDGNRDLRASVDGGAEGANIIVNSATASLILQGRNYAPNVIVPIVSGLVLGIHTVKVRINAAITTTVLGFEILNESSTLRVAPGISYVGGKQLTLAAAQSIAYNSSFETGTLGTRGGRAVVYQKADGTIGKAVTPAGSQLNLTAADHTNEEMVRTYYWREFGAGRSDDFSLFSSTSPANMAFTLDDGVTTLVGSGVAYYTSSDGVYLYANGSFTTLTFVGTGLDIVHSENSVSVYVYEVFVDGSTVGTFSTVYASSKIQKLVSGLSYGTHTVKIVRNSASTDAPHITAFKVYQPKKPSIPAGAIELCDYNVMATYVQGTTGLNTVATGVLRKSTTREMTYVEGTSADTAWSIAVDSTVIGGNALFSNRSGSNMFSGTFFGTGAELRTSSYTNGDTTISVFIDGVAATSANFPSATFSFYGANGGSFTASTGTLSLRGSGNYNDNNSFAGFSVSGLSLGKHTITLSKGTTGSFAALFVYALDIITPIHSVKSNTVADLQNTLPVGSQALSDNRKTSAIKDSLPSQKAWAQAVGITSAPSTTSTFPIPCPDLSCTVKVSTATQLKVSATAGFTSTASSMNGYIQIYVDGVAFGPTANIYLTNGSAQAVPAGTLFISAVVPVSAGTHKVDLYWISDGAPFACRTTSRILTVEEK